MLAGVGRHERRIAETVPHANLPSIAGVYRTLAATRRIGRSPSSVSSRPTPAPAGRPTLDSIFVNVLTLAVIVSPRSPVEPGQLANMRYLRKRLS